MKSLLKRLVRKFSPFAFLDPEGDEGIKKRGHRGYVGGMWDEIGNLQLEFLKSKGLKPEHYLLDIACGSLRLGVKAIPYLDKEHYLGIEKEPGLVDAGLTIELDQSIRSEKMPSIVISDSFEFDKLPHKADYAIAQSLFTHLPPSLIELCFKKLFPHMSSGGVFYATYFEGKMTANNPDKPHDHGSFVYTRDEMLSFGDKVGFTSSYIGDWNHPRKQVIVEYRKD